MFLHHTSSFKPTLEKRCIAKPWSSYAYRYVNIPLVALIVILLSLTGDVAAETEVCLDESTWTLVVQKLFNNFFQPDIETCSSAEIRHYRELTHWPSVYRRWTGKPFVVNVSYVFADAEDILDDIAEEAERVRQQIGYEVFVAGDVLLYWPQQVRSINEVPLGTPGPGEIWVLCCAGTGMDWSGYSSPPMGVASPARGIMLLSRPEDYLHQFPHPPTDSSFARRALIHELYHLLGLSHTGAGGIEMSYPLMHGIWSGSDVYRPVNWQLSPLQSDLAADPADRAVLPCLYPRER